MQLENYGNARLSLRSSLKDITNDLNDRQQETVIKKKLELFSLSTHNHRNAHLVKELDMVRVVSLLPIHKSSEKAGLTFEQRFLLQSEQRQYTQYRSLRINLHPPTLIHSFVHE